MPTTQHKPFQGFAPAAVDYLNTLAANNNKTWFSEHKGEFKELLQFPMQDLAAQVYDAMLCRRPDAQLAVKLSRIYRDQRRYKDGSYCHTRLWFNIFDPAIPDGPYFWFEVGHERWNYGLSLLTVSPATMETFRQKLKSTTFAFTIKNYHDQLCQDTEFHLYASMYQRPKPNPPAGLELWFNLRSFLIAHQSTNFAEISAHDLPERIVRGFLSLWPFYSVFCSLS